jgi:hypothetical protein
LRFSPMPKRAAVLEGFRLSPWELPRGDDYVSQAYGDAPPSPLTLLRSKPGRELAGAALGTFASGLVDMFEVGGVAGARTNILRVRCKCGQDAPAPSPKLFSPPTTDGAALTLPEVGAFLALHGEHGGVTATTHHEDGTTSDGELSPELASFAGGAARGILSGSLARAAHSAAELFRQRAAKGPRK